jgi:two-component system sensor histidine kinase QseC
VKSIRARLSTSLCAGFALLLVGGGLTFYLFSRRALINQFDASLEGKALAMTTSVQLDGSRLEVRFPELSQQHGLKGLDLFQCWRDSGEIVFKSKSLGRRDLPFELGAAETPRLRDVTFAGGLVVRAVGLRFHPVYEDEDGERHGRKGEASPEIPLRLVLAADRSELDRTIQSLALIVLGASGFAMLATVLVVKVVLKQGLAPLDKVAEQAGNIDARSLEPCFPAHGLPSELQPIADRLNSLLLRLGQSFNDLNEYSAKVAHELRTPLAILRLKIEQAGQEMPELAEELQSQLHQLNYVVEQSLLIAKAEQGRLAVKPQLFDIAALVEDLVADFSLLAEEEKRSVRLEQPVRTEIAADQGFVRQVIHNLMNNALKHGRGEIRVKLVRDTDRCILTIANKVRREPLPAAERLGLGLRVVEKLVALQAGVKIHKRRGSRYYAVRLIFPAATTLKAELSGPMELAEAVPAEA